jgi:hypothetical protein
MSRGPQPLEAQEESQSIAERRGHLQRYQHRKGNICDFTIMCPGIVCFVCAMRLVKLSSMPEDILHDYAEVIGDLRFIASSPAISRELWLRSPRGAWRFFRILNDGIIELDKDGMPLANGAGPVKESSLVGAGTVIKTKPTLPAGKNPAANGRDAAGKNPEPEKSPETTTTTEKNPAPANADGSGSVPAQSPAPANHPGHPDETDQTRFPKINLELIRRFMRWKKERQKQEPGSG